MKNTLIALISSALVYIGVESATITQDYISSLIITTTGLILASLTRSVLVFITVSAPIIYNIIIYPDNNISIHNVIKTELLPISLLFTLILLLFMIKQGLRADRRIMQQAKLFFKNNPLGKYSTRYLRYYVVFLLLLSLFYNALDIGGSHECIPAITTLFSFALLLPYIVSTNTIDEFVEVSSILLLAPLSAAIPLAYYLDKNLILKYNFIDCIDNYIAEIEAIITEKPLNTYEFPVPTPTTTTKWGLEKVRGKIRFCIKRLQHAAPHILITGSTGAGKTYLATKIIRYMLSDSIPAIIIDPHGEYKYSIKDAKTVKLSIDNLILLPIGETPKERAYEVAEIFRILFNIGPLQEQLLYESIIEAYMERGVDIDKEYTIEEASNLQPPRLEDVAVSLTRITRARGIPHESIYSLTRYINMLAGIPERKEELATTINALTELLIAENNTPVIFDLSEYRTEHRKYLAVETLMRILYYTIPTLYRKGYVKRLLIAVDEAHLFVKSTSSSKAPILVKISREQRKYGIILLLITQNITDISAEMINNIGYFFALRSIEENNRRKTASLISGYSEPERILLIEHILTVLPLGYALVREPRIPEPLLLRIP